ncbi:MAG: DNA replication and repair protein RecF [Rikenellaceae bacterium]
MELKTLSLINFKNVAEARLDFTPSINALVGDNGAGKTNVIDAIHFLAMAKSMMTMTDRQSIRHEEPFFVVDGTFSSDEGSTQGVVCSFSRQQTKGTKSLKRNGKEYERLSDHVGMVPVVVVTPQDIALVYDGAEERRRFINSFISQLDPIYLRELIRYNATLSQRNMLLKQRGDESMLLIYDEQLSLSASIIHSKRHEIISEMQPLVEEYYKLLSNDREAISINYISQLQEAPLTELLLASRQRDRALEHTSVGVHRDDIELKIGGLPLRKYGSQGQQKSLLIALKLAQYRIVSQRRAERPILLLDDLFDKLDRHRVTRLIEIVSSPHFGQIFITDCNPTRLESILSTSATPYSLYHVEGGSITKQQ